MKKIIYIVIFINLIFYNSKSINSEWVVYNKLNSSLPENYIIDLVINNKDNIWIISSKITKFDGINWTVFPDSVTGFYDDNFASIAIDKKGIVVIGSRLWGLITFDGLSWKHFTKENTNLLYDSFFSLVVDDSNNKWLGTPWFSLTKFNDFFGETYSADNEQLGLQTFSIAIDSSGNKWIGSASYINDSGLGILEKFDGQNWLRFDPSEGLPSSNGIFSIAIDKEQNKWIGTLFGGFVKYDDSTWIVYNTSNSGLPDNSVNAIAIDEKDVKWIGTRGGLAKFDDTSWTVWNSDNSELPSNQINCIVIDKYGNKWIGTDNGLAVFREGGVVGVEEPKENKEVYLSCYPNPVNNVLTLNINNTSKSDFSNLKFYSLYGEEVQLTYKNILGNTFEFDVSQLPSGIYFISALINNKVERLKFVKVE